MGEVKITPIIESYNQEDECLYIKTYLFIKGYAIGRNLKNTLKALPLARKAHNGQYRKGTVSINGKDYSLPYLLHVLKVCATLISLSLPFCDEELDILLCCAILHDYIEEKDECENGGQELVSIYGFPEEVYQIVKMLSKRTGATEYELSAYFNSIKKNKNALLIKMADRSHNVEDLYNMKPEKLQKYVKETRDFIYPLATYAKANYPELSNAVTILKSKIVSLTELTETIVEIYDQKIAEVEAHYKEIISERDMKIQELKDEVRAAKL